MVYYNYKKLIFQKKQKTKTKTKNNEECKDVLKTNFETTSLF